MCVYVCVCACVCESVCVSSPIANFGQEAARASKEHYDHQNDELHALIQERDSEIDKLNAQLTAIRAGARTSADALLQMREHVMRLMFSRRLVCVWRGLVEALRNAVACRQMLR